MKIGLMNWNYQYNVGIQIVDMVNCYNKIKSQQIYLNQRQMQSQQNISQFIAAFSNNEQKLLMYTLSLIKPKDEQQMKINSKLIFGAVSKILQELSDKSSITKLSKFILMLIIAGHFHIFESFDKYFLPQLITISSSVLKYTGNTDQELNINWKYQFSSQLLQLLAHWFPNDFIEYTHPSKYSKVVDKKKVILKKNMIFTLPFVHQVEKQLQKIIGINNQACIHCVHCYEKVQSKLLDKQNNTVSVINNGQNWNMAMADKISKRMQRNGAKRNNHTNINNNMNINTSNINMNRNDQNNQNILNITFSHEPKEQHKEENKNAPEKRQRRKVKLLRGKQEDM